MTLDSYRLRALHLVAIWAYGVTQPVLSLVDGNPDLVVGRGASRTDVMAIVLLVALVPPLLAVGYAWLASRFAPWIGNVVYLFLLGLFLAPIALQVAKWIEPRAIVVVMLVGALCAGGVALYARFRAVRLFVGFSVVLPVLGIVWFWQGIPSLTGEARAADVVVRSPHPIVMVVLDELPVSSLMTRSGRIDAVRYPAFGRLERDAVWYRNATTVYDETAWAVPALLTGKTPPEAARSTAADHPENLFTLLGGAYTQRVREVATRLCPPSVCPGESQSTADRLGSLFDDVRRVYVTRVVPESISSSFRVVDFDTVLEEASDETLGDFHALVDEIRPGADARSLYFTHLFLPHAPWRFLPSGTAYPFRGTDGWDGTTDFWRDDPRLVRQGQQRHLLQLQYTDALIGRLLSRLRDAGLYDRALIVVTADHGVSFVPGAARRRPVSLDNVADLANIPLFVKYPDQRVGRIDDRGARTIDVLPTIADVLGIELPWKLDGRSLLDEGWSRSRVVVRQRGADRVVAPLGRVEAGRGATLRRQSAAFGEGADSLFAVGANEQLLGARVDPRWLRRSGGSRARLDRPSDFASVELSSGFLPARVSGEIDGSKLSPETELAVAVNGRVAALAIVFDDYGRQRFSALVPDSAFRAGSNAIDVFAVSVSGRAVRLSRL